jgi:hypothetical protein
MGAKESSGSFSGTTIISPRRSRRWFGKRHLGGAGVVREDRDGPVRSRWFVEGRFEVPGRRRRRRGLVAHRLEGRRCEIFVTEGEGRVRVFEAHRIGFSGDRLGSREVTEVVVEEVETVGALRNPVRGCRHRLRGRDRSRLPRGSGGWCLGEQAVHLVDERLGLEGFGDVTRRAHARSALFVERFEGTREEQHGNVGEVGVGFDRLAHLVAVLPRHDDVGEDQVRTRLHGALQRFVPVVDGHEGHVLARKTDIHDLLDRNTVIRQQKRLGHVPPSPTRKTTDRSHPSGTLRNVLSSVDTPK